MAQAIGPVRAQSRQARDQFQVVANRRQPEKGGIVEPGACFFYRNYAFGKIP